MSVLTTTKKNLRFRKNSVRAEDGLVTAIQTSSLMIMSEALLDSDKLEDPTL